MVIGDHMNSSVLFSGPSAKLPVIYFPWDFPEVIIGARQHLRLGIPVIYLPRDF